MLAGSGVTGCTHRVTGEMWSPTFMKPGPGFVRRLICTSTPVWYPCGAKKVKGTGRTGKLSGSGNRVREVVR